MKGLISETRIRNKTMKPIDDNDNVFAIRARKRKLETMRNFDIASLVRGNDSFPPKRRKGGERLKMARNGACGRRSRLYSYLEREFLRDKIEKERGLAWKNFCPRPSFAHFSRCSSRADLILEMYLPLPLFFGWDVFSLSSDSSIFWLRTSINLIAENLVVQVARNWNRSNDYYLIYWFVVRSVGIIDTNFLLSNRANE